MFPVGEKSVLLVVLSLLIISILLETGNYGRRGFLPKAIDLCKKLDFLLYDIVKVQFSAKLIRAQEKSFSILAL